MAFTGEVALPNADINRIALDMEIDFSDFDVVMDFSNMESLGMITKLPAFSLDMKNTKQISALKNRAQELGASYISYDDLLEKLTSKVYTEILKAKNY
jgi:hypothetical protein